MTFDLAIIGAGPAGLAAAITARSRYKDCLVISNKFESSALARSERVDNYPGMPRTSGLQLLETMYGQAHSLGAQFSFERLISILPYGREFGLSTSSEVYSAKAVVLAIGTQSVKPLEGEAEFLGRGVSYCATCDGMLYRDRKVVLYGLSDESIHEANFLMQIGCEVYFLSPDLDKSAAFASGLAAGVNLIEGRLTAIVGGEFGMAGVRYTTANANYEQILDCQGVFILRPSIAPAALVSGLKMDGAFISVDERLSTTVPGIFAAGDCVGGRLQIAKSVGQGQMAAFSAIDYLESV
ncbi:MAG: FAD-dependent oxidoreductase [Coriobacteriia bacterium]|nr:FAD-dependent oxidoreductase [Coriobacteriia bacterium]